MHRLKSAISAFMKNCQSRFQTASFMDGPGYLISKGCAQRKFPTLIHWLQIYNSGSQLRLCSTYCSWLHWYSLFRKEKNTAFWQKHMISMILRSKANNSRDVHVVLVSLLADQLSSQFFFIFWSPKKNWPVSETGNFFLSTLLNFFFQSRY